MGSIIDRLFAVVVCHHGNISNRGTELISRILIKELWSNNTRDAQPTVVVTSASNKEPMTIVAASTRIIILKGEEGEEQEAQAT